jgi:alkanesulfonate monooxygenase SsuD/methylene tetrahydromethanopterin reductase-like flavin-dependent oxidoreductase (luciferase family)
VLDDRFITGFALAGTAEQVIAQAAQYRRAGADELALSFAGPQPPPTRRISRRLSNA